MIVLLSLSPEWSVYFLFTKALNSAKALANERFIAPIVLESKYILYVTETALQCAVSYWDTWGCVSRQVQCIKCCQCRPFLSVACAHFAVVAATSCLRSCASCIQGYLPLPWSKWPTV